MGSTAPLQPGSPSPAPPHLATPTPVLRVGHSFNSHPLRSEHHDDNTLDQRRQQLMPDVAPDHTPSLWVTESPFTHPFRNFSLRFPANRIWRSRAATPAVRLPALQRQHCWNWIRDQKSHANRPVDPVITMSQTAVPTPPQLTLSHSQKMSFQRHRRRTQVAHCTAFPHCQSVTSLNMSTSETQSTDTLRAYSQDAFETNTPESLERTISAITLRAHPKRVPK